MGIESNTEALAFLHRMGNFFNAIVGAFLVLGVVSTLLDDRTSMGTPRGMLVPALATVYAAWVYHFAARRAPLAYRSRRWGVIYLLGALTLAVLLQRLSPIFVALIWATVGQSMGMFRLPWGALAGTACALLALAVSGAFPRRLSSAEDAIQLGSNLLLVVLYVGFGVVVYQLIRARFRNERLIGELREAQRQLEAGARQARELAVLRERTRLAREIHDGLGHTLTLIAVKAEAVGRLQAVDSERAAQQLASIKELARGGVADLKRSVANLRAPELERQSLAGAIADLARDCAEQAGWALDLDLPSDLPPLPAATEEALWRVAQEGLANVLKHARAGRVAVALTRAGDRLSLSITDDGRGMPARPAPEPDGHYGLRGLNERLEALGGLLAIRSTPAAGTVLRAELPATWSGESDERRATNDESPRTPEARGDSSFVARRS
jgi:signal transduction histidine kinase